MPVLDVASEIIVGLAIFAFVFTIGRKLWLWYWRIPEIEKELREIGATLKRMERRNQASGT